MAKLKELKIQLFFYAQFLIFVFLIESQFLLCPIQSIFEWVYQRDSDNRRVVYSIICNSK